MYGLVGGVNERCILVVVAAVFVRIFDSWCKVGDETIMEFLSGVVGESRAGSTAHIF